MVCARVLRKGSCDVIIDKTLLATLSFTWWTNEVSANFISNIITTRISFRHTKLCN